jgi:hypothetical protein
LFCGFVDGDLVRNIHVVELVDTVDSIIASMIAPASIVKSPVSSSLTAAAVRPAEEALPEVYTERGRGEQMCLERVLEH